MPQDIVFILFYFILFIFQNEEATASTLRKNLMNGNEPANKCENCEGLSEKGKKETRMNYTKEKKSKYFQKLNNNFYKYKYLEKLADNYYLSKAWGATGMPFNVLYTPNTYQQKILKFVPWKEQARRYSESKKGVPEIYNLVLEDEKPRPKSKENLKKNQHSARKYHSLIPQLFVSYGW